MTTTYGTDGPDIIIGDNNGDTIFGLGGDDQLVGGTGDDTLDGGTGHDILSGGPGHDILTGGPDSDIYRGTAANLNGDEITNFKVGDRIQITDLAEASANIGTSGNALTYGIGDSVTIDNLGPGRLVLRPISNTGTEIRLQENAHNDFNGDGHSDILWEQDGGLLFDWTSTGNGSFVSNAGNFSTTVGTEWRVVGTGDFNGDSHEDILWQKDATGELLDWLGTPNGAFTTNAANFDSSIPSSVHIVGMGDFNADGITDILMRNDSGVLFDWLGNSSGGFAPNTANFSTTVSTEWRVIGTGDFNGDGISDILWRQDVTGHLLDWLGTSNGSFNTNPQNFDSSVPSNIQFQGTGDFNGDGISDILWRDGNTGTLFDWLGNSSGGFSNNTENFSTVVSTEWRVVSIGDFNGDGIDDVLWKQDGTGHLLDWLGTSSGAFNTNAANFDSSVPSSVHIQDPFF